MRFFSCWSVQKWAPRLTDVAADVDAVVAAIARRGKLLVFLVFTNAL
jgi:hypothetical protein